VDENINAPSDNTEEQLPSGAAPVVEGADEGAIEGEDQTPKAEKTYKEEEWRTRQSAWDKQQAETKRQFDESVAKLQVDYEALQVKIDEASAKDFLAKIEAADGDLDMARAMVEGQKTLAKQMRDFGKQKAELEAQRASVETGARLIAADELARRHDLPAEARAKLLECKTTAEMEISALNMRIAQMGTKQKKATKVDGGGGTGSSIDVNKLTPGQQIELGYKQMKNKN